MKMNKWMVLAAGLAFAGLGASAQESMTVYPTAILPFHERGEGVRGYGSTASDILFAALVANPDLLLVDRAEIDKTLAEQELNLSGMVSPGDAVKVGNLIGAKVLVTGSVIDADQTTYLVARIIGTELAGAYTWYKVETNTPTKSAR